MGWDYNPYTWHSNRDTYDKIAWDDLRSNATLIAMLAYLASEDARMPRDRAAIISSRTGQPAAWPACSRPARSSAEGR